MFDKLLKIFNNREISIFIWVVVLLIILLSNKKTRQCSVSVIRAFFKLSRWYMAMLIYITGIVYLFYKMQLCDFSLLKNTCYWTFGGAFLLFFNVNKALENKKHFFKVFKDCFKLILIVEFLSSLYSFNLAIELISIPILVFTGAMLGFSENKPEYKSVYKAFNGVLILYGLGVLVFSVIQISDNIESVLTVKNLKSLVFGSAMTLSLIPFLYFLVLYMAYERFLKMKKIILKENKKLYQFLKWRVLWKCRFNFNKVRLIRKKLHVYTSIEKEQINIELESILIKNE